MNDIQYLKLLKKNLAGLDRKTKQDILLEIGSSADDKVQDSLYVRFGSPESLAQKYLEDVIIKPSLQQRLWRVSKLFMMVFGLLLLIVIGVILWFINQKDDFDYGNINAQELQNKTWHSLTGAQALNISQAQVVLYPSQSNMVEFSCARDEQRLLKVSADGVIHIEQNQCFLRIPNSVNNISTSQTELILNAITGDKALDIFQTNIRIVQPFHYTVITDLNQCMQEFPLSSLVGKATMTLKGKQCSIEAYEAKQ